MTPSNMTTTPKPSARITQPEVLVAIQRLIEQQTALLRLLQEDTTATEPDHEATRPSADNTNDTQPEHEPKPEITADLADARPSSHHSESHDTKLPGLLEWIQASDDLIKARCADFIEWLKHAGGPRQVFLVLPSGTCIVPKALIREFVVEIESSWFKIDPVYLPERAWDILQMWGTISNNFRLPFRIYDLVGDSNDNEKAWLRLVEPKSGTLSLVSNRPDHSPDAIRRGTICLTEPVSVWGHSGREVLPFHSIALMFDMLGMYRCRCAPPGFDLDGFRAQHKDPNCPHERLATFSMEWGMGGSSVSVRSHNSSFLSFSRAPCYEVQFLVRSISVSAGLSGGQVKPLGILCHREFGSLSFGGKSEIFQERRTSLSLTIDFDSEKPGEFAIVKISHNDGLDRIPFNKVAETGLIPCSILGGLTTFQLTLLTALEAWKKDWHEALAGVNRLLSIKMNDYLESTSRQKLMYDNFQLSRSEFYFSLLQLLRQFSDWIDETAVDVARLREQSLRCLEGAYEAQTWDQEVAFIRHNWDTVFEQHKLRSQELKDRVSRKIQTTESLRDGLFNAQSVREAVRGTQINQFLLVFTVVTILYLPPTFVATFYGMDLFVNEENLSATRTQFWTVLAVISGATYLVAIGVLSRAEQVKTILRLLAGIWDRIRSRIA
ncbi:cora-like Mg2+ transporter protein-domain-containing protein [Cladorrhinum sp. PSN259]|nr:cora-like Mg2+ transporter protein-domain-containing protein [Cladorrhinum sp. PSN259]